jgi:hypothetical protein
VTGRAGRNRQFGEVATSFGGVVTFATFTCQSRIVSKIAWNEINDLARFAAL